MHCGITGGGKSFTKGAIKPMRSLPGLQVSGLKSDVWQCHNGDQSAELSHTEFLYRHTVSDLRIVTAEAYASVEETMAYCGNDTNPGAHFTFNFNLVSRPTSVQDFDNLVHQWVDNVPKGKQPNRVAGNHENPRVATRYGPAMVDAVNMLVTLLPGTPVTYNGEEIGMTDLAMESPNDSRDPERTPFQWDDSTSAGML
ncbi:hypothetical protein Cfor_08679 [Coptotermes formosanus]|uniref:Glycosyl hydrolase family 13 catalytic domain-containing protein n=1 Tax=Coptotermes formosanus TaxID=36987 RepID=A0A6L2PWG3_COPFO|nr:hypothetical protein Cfor_08679 [Coptotermes formosanus]